ncbi:unnamed protein product [Urochloa humidicola]
MQSAEGQLKPTLWPSFNFHKALQPEKVTSHNWHIDQFERLYHDDKMLVHFETESPLVVFQLLQSLALVGVNSVVEVHLCWCCQTNIQFKPLRMSFCCAAYGIPGHVLVQYPQKHAVSALQCWHGRGINGVYCQLLIQDNPSAVAFLQHCLEIYGTVMQVDESFGLTHLSKLTVGLLQSFQCTMLCAFENSKEALGTYQHLLAWTIFPLHLITVIRHLLLIYVQKQWPLFIQVEIINHGVVLQPTPWTSSGNYAGDVHLKKSLSVLLKLITIYCMSKVTVDHLITQLKLGGTVKFNSFLLTVGLQVKLLSDVAMTIHIIVYLSFLCAWCHTAVIQLKPHSPMLIILKWLAEWEGSSFGTARISLSLKYQDEYTADEISGQRNGFQHVPILLQRQQTTHYSFFHGITRNQQVLHWDPGEGQHFLDGCISLDCSIQLAVMLIVLHIVKKINWTQSQILRTNQMEKLSLSASSRTDGCLNIHDCSSHVFIVRYAQLKPASTKYIQASAETQMILQQKRGGFDPATPQLPYQNNSKGLSYLDRCAHVKLLVVPVPKLSIGWQPLGVYGCQPNSNGRTDMPHLIKCKWERTDAVLDC